MKVMIDIPEEFEIDYRTDRFGDFFKRAKADMSAICGRYERETAEVLSKAFQESLPYDLDKVVEQLEDYLFEKYCVEGDAEIERIVKGGGVDG